MIQKIIYLLTENEYIRLKKGKSGISLESTEMMNEWLKRMKVSEETHIAFIHESYLRNNLTKIIVDNFMEYFNSKFTNKNNACFILGADDEKNETIDEQYRKSQMLYHLDGNFKYRELYETISGYITYGNDKNIKVFIHSSGYEKDPIMTMIFYLAITNVMKNNHQIELKEFYLTNSNGDHLDLPVFIQSLK